jgi:hypothetical protein
MANQSMQNAMQEEGTPEDGMMAEGGMMGQEQPNLE